jgi:hypothetical protein
MVAPVIAGMICGGVAGYPAGLIYESVPWGIALGLIGGLLAGILWVRTFSFALVRRAGAVEKTQDLGGKIGMLVGWLCTILLHVGLWLASGFSPEFVRPFAMAVGLLSGGIAGWFVGVIPSKHADQIRAGRLTRLSPVLLPDVRIPRMSRPFVLAAVLMGAWGMVAGFALGRVGFIHKSAMFGQHSPSAAPLELAGAAAGLATAAVEFLLMTWRARRRIKTGRLASCNLEIEALLLAVAAGLLAGAAAFGGGMCAQGWWNTEAFVFCLMWTLAAALCTGIFWGTVMQWAAEATARRLSWDPGEPLSPALAEDRGP